MSFWVDYKKNINVDYDKFLKLLLEDGENNIYIKEDNPFNVFLNLLRNFLNLKTSILLDADFSEKEILDIGINKDYTKEGVYKQQNLHNKIASIEEVINFLEENKNEISVEIYTSGTTGRPKKVIQSFTNLVRAVKRDKKLKNNVWAFAYNPTHFAGLQVFFQAFYNLNEIVYVFNLDYDKVYNSIKERKVTNLSSTPTFMKLLLSYIIEPITTIKTLTFGGERFDSNLLKKLEEKIPKAKINNVYASTEAGSLFRSDGESFIIPDRYSSFVKIVDNELYIHKNLLGKSDSFNLDGEWYKTGDTVELLSEKKFVFKNRKSEMINVGGYKVNPDEVENIIKNIDGVKDAYISGRNNSLMGQIIVATVIKEANIEEANLKKNIKEVTKSQLQDFKIPRIIKFVNSFDLTRTGKIKKK